MIKNNYKLLDSFIRENLRYSVNTLSSYELDLKDFLDYYPKEIAALDGDDVDDWVSFLFRNGNQANTIRRKMSSLKSFWFFCIEKKAVEGDPFIGIDWPIVSESRKGPITRENLFMLREAARENNRDRAIIETLYVTGVRVSELINIKLDDIDWDNLVFTITGKRNRTRLNPFTAECAERIKRYLKSRSDTSPYLFITLRKKPFTRQGVWKMIKKYALKADIAPSVSPHILRHTMASHMADRGANTAVIAEFLGDVNLSSARRYIRRKLTQEGDVYLG